VRYYGKKITISLIIALFCWQIGLAWGAEQKVISWGADLTDREKQQIWGFFPSGLKSEEPAQTLVTNREERGWLQSLVPDEVIGTKAISSVYLEILPQGSGIQIETKNISWVTKEMFENALVTAGLKDAKVIAVAPYQVSGTAALAGIFKAFETASGKKLDQQAKKTASQELITTGYLGDAIGNKEQAVELVSKVKEEVIKRQLSDPAAIKQIVTQICQDSQLQLTPEQIQQVVDLMKGIAALHLDLQQISGQLKVMGDKLEKVWQSNQDVQTMVEKVYAFLQKLSQQIMTFLSQYFGPEKS